MAAGDPTNPTPPIITPDQTENMRAHGEVLNTYNNTAANTAPILADWAKQAGLTANQVAIMTSAALGATDAFSNLGGSVDTTRLSTFNNQIDELTKSLSKPGTAAGDITNAIKSMGDMLTRSASSTQQATDIQSIFGNALKSGAKLTGESITELMKYAKTILSTADDHLKLQSAMVQQSAAMGTLGNLYKQTGEGLEHFNSLSQHQADVIVNVQKIMGGSISTWANYASQLNQVPGVLDNMLKSTDKSSAANTLLARTIEYATGSGRKYEDVVADMKKGVMEFGLSQDNALKYTARMTEASSMLGIPVEELRTSLNSSADAFRMYTTNGENAAKMTQSMQQAMVNYMQSLKDVGVPMQGQIELAGEMAKAVGDMGIAQKAFLSGQTGGPGGLMGAFQIDKMMKDGDIKGVMDKVKASIQRQIGHMVTVEEAAKSNMAGAQMTKQIMLLRNGPLGSFAKSDVEAERLSEAMIKGKGMPAGKQFGDKGNLTLDNATNKGIEIAQTSQSYLHEILVTLNEMKTSSGSRVLGEVQHFTARSGAPSGTGDKLPDLQKHLRSFQDAGIHPPAVNSSTQALRDVKEKQPEGLSDLKNALVDALSSGNQTVARDTAKTIQAELAKKRAENPTDKNTQQMADHVSKLVNQAMTDTRGINLFHPPEDPSAVNDNLNAAGRVGKAATSSTHRHAAIGDNATTDQPHKRGFVGPDQANNNQGPVPVTLVGSALTVNFTGKCQHCGLDIYDSAQTQIGNPAST